MVAAETLLTDEGRAASRRGSSGRTPGHLTESYGRISGIAMLTIASWYALPSSKACQVVEGKEHCAQQVAGRAAVVRPSEGPGGSPRALRATCRSPVVVGKEEWK